MPDSAFQEAPNTFSRALLLERAPILFSAEVPLFESEMDDNGVSACTVRVRFHVSLPALKPLRGM